MRLLLFTCLLLGHVFGQGNNIELIARLDYQNLHNTLLNDVWAYVDENGNEYALVGARKGVSIVSLADPSNPEEVFWIDGSTSIWRDLHVFNDYAYVTTEAEDGLLIIDLSPLPDGEITSTVNFFGNAGNPWSTAHNLWIDENGFCYIFGANSGVGGVIIYDIFTNPMAPQEVGSFEEWYVHDGFVRGDTMYLAHIYEGTMSVVDVTNKSNPILLGVQATPSNFAHNIWPSDNGKFAFTTDEVSGGFLTAYNIEDPTNIFELDRIQSSPGQGIVPHNTHFFNDYIVTSYYADGVTIHDVKDPENIVKVGQYDTYPGTSTSTIGCWGAYPYLPSGILLASDIENGLFILQPNYVEAARMSGIVRNSVTNEVIQGVAISLPQENVQRSTDIAGVYKVGIAASVNRTVNFFKYGYEPFSGNFAFQQGITIPFNLALVPIPAFPLTVKVEDVDGNPILNAFVRIKYLTEELNTTSDGLGLADFSLFYDDEYDITVGKWGYKTTCQTIQINENTQEVTIVLGEGIYDDFAFDFGWTTFGNAEKGAWERGIPIGAQDNGIWQKPFSDSPIDCDEYVFITGNSSDVLDNVTNGTVNLISPIFDATGLEEPFIYYERWFFNFFGPTTPNDTLRIVLSNGLVSKEIDKIGSMPATFGQWIPVSIRMRDFMEPTANMQLFISVADDDATGNIVHAAIDHFQVTNGSILAQPHLQAGEVRVYPNPSQQSYMIEGISSNQLVTIYDATGKLVHQFVSKNELETIEATNWKAGVYFLKVNAITKRLIKMD